MIGNIYENKHRSHLKSAIKLAYPELKFFVVKALLQDKRTLEDINATATNGMTPLMWAVQLEESGIVMLLLEFGASPTIRDLYDL